MLELIVIFLVLVVVIMYYWIRKVYRMHQELKIVHEKLQHSLNEKEDKLSSLLHTYDDNVIASKTDLQGNITYASKAFCRSSEFSKEELIGQNHNIVRHPLVSKAFYEKLWKDLHEDKEWKGEMVNLSKHGRSYWVDTIITPEFDEQGNKIGYNSVRHDITAKKQLEELTRNLEQKVRERTEELEELSITDALTNLYNRRHFEKVLDKEFQRCKRQKANFIFCVFDVDMFKQYNDTYGHVKGDEVLILLAKVIQDFTQRANDFAFRIGGEEFCLMSSNMSEEEATEFIQTLRDRIEALKIVHAKNTASPYVTASFGLVVVDFTHMSHTVFDKRYTPENVHHLADQLLYKAKDSGRNNIVVQTL